MDCVPQQEYGVPGVAATMSAPSEYLASDEEEGDEWSGEDDSEPDVAGGLVEEQPDDASG